MKKITVIAIMLLATVTFAQSKNEQATIEVDGVCMMCKSRIEKACLATKGVKSANWSVETHELKLYYNAQKTNLDSIKTKIASVGHDTKDIKATEEQYLSVHPCCRYRDDALKDEHKE
ncbi:heavy-metal-associated domain-containing protein [Neotamlana laminarinivorans]|uniref:Cation transporter n=1 Tax=Neotamlana laminarinivorans TaxID=2883124 RepID=A0A9X1L509_9FLAO|nr:heavy metal-associated domain-containing protein [Tamlana laminarinivorans]MCB4799917.1 cation transporter [Tamlana laminarinivorans]